MSEIARTRESKRGEGWGVNLHRKCKQRHITHQLQINHGTRGRNTVQIVKKQRTLYRYMHMRPLFGNLHLYISYLTATHTLHGPRRIVYSLTLASTFERGGACNLSALLVQKTQSYVTGIC